MHVSLRVEVCTDLAESKKAKPSGWPCSSEACKEYTRAVGEKSVIPGKTPARKHAEKKWKTHYHGQNSCDEEARAFYLAEVREEDGTSSEGESEDNEPEDEEVGFHVHVTGLVEDFSAAEKRELGN